MLKIWGRANSINVQKVLWCCCELALEYERIDAGNEFVITKTPGYRELNPNGLVPTIEDGDFLLWESNVIVRYLAHKAGDDASFRRRQRRALMRNDGWIGRQPCSGPPCVPFLSS